MKKQYRIRDYYGKNVEKQSLEGLRKQLEEAEVRAVGSARWLKKPSPTVCRVNRSMTHLLAWNMPLAG